MQKPNSLNATAVLHLDLPSRGKKAGARYKIGLE